MRAVRDGKTHLRNEELFKLTWQWDVSKYNKKH